MPNKHLKDGFNTISVGTKPRGSIAKHLKRERFSYDENVGVDVFKIDVKDGEIDLTDSTVTLLYRFFQNDVEYVLKDEVNAIVTDKETIEISRNEKLKNINTTVDVYVYVKFSDNQSIDLFAYSLDFTTSEIDKVAQNQPVPDFDYLDDTKLMKEFETVVQNKINEIESIDLVGGYYNKTEIDAMFEALPEIEEVDLSDYVTKQELDTKISDIVIPDVSEFVTEKQVDDKISEIEIPDTSQFITESDVDTKISDIVIPDVSEFVTEKQVDDKISEIEIPDTSQFITESDVDTKISDIVIPDVSEFVTEKQVDDKISEIEIPDTSQFITESDVDTKISDIVIPDVSEFVTEQFVKDEIDKIEIPDNGNVDLSDYVTNEELEDKLEQIEIPDVSNFITEQQVDNKISEIQIPDMSEFLKSEDLPDTSQFITKSEVDNKIAQIEIPEPVEVDLSDYVTNETLDNKIQEINFPDVSEFLTQEDLPDTSQFITSSEVDNKIAQIKIPDPIDVDLSDYVTNETLDNKIQEINIPDVSGFLTQEDLPDTSQFITSSEVDNKIAQIKIPDPIDVDLSDYVTNETLDNKIQEINIPDVSGFLTQEDLPDTSQFITSSEVDNKISEIQIPDVSSFVTEQFVKDEIDKIEIPDPIDVDLSDYVTNETLDNKIQEINIPDVSEFLTQEDLPDTSQFITGTEVDTKISDIVIPDVSSFVTEQDVDNKIAQIEIPDTKDFVQKGDLNPFSISNIEIYRNTHVSPKNLTDEWDNPVLSRYGITLDIKFDNPDNVPEEIDVNIFQKLNGANPNGAYPYELIPCYSKDYVEPDWSEYPPIEPASNYIHKLKRDGETHRCNILYNRYDGTGDEDDLDNALFFYEELKRYQNFKVELLGETFESFDPLYVNNPFHESFPVSLPEQNADATIFDVSVNSTGMLTMDTNLFDENNQIIFPDLGYDYNTGVMVGLGLLSFSTDNFVEPSVRIVNENDFGGYIPQSHATITNLDTGEVKVKDLAGIGLRVSDASDGGDNDTENMKWVTVLFTGGDGNYQNENFELVIDATNTIFETNNTLVEFDLVLQITDDSSGKVFYRTLPVKCVRK